MKAIQIKFLGCTDTKPSRLKAWSEGNVQAVTTIDHGKDIDLQAKELAEHYALEMWNMNLTGFGSLPNGDFVATVGDKS